MFESFASFFTTVQVVLIASGAAFVAGVIFSQKVKDWVKGVPTDLRKALKGVEGDVLERVRAAQAEVISKLLTTSPAPVAEKVALPPEPTKIPTAASDAADAVVKLPPVPAPAPLPSEAPPVTPAIT